MSSQLRLEDDQKYWVRKIGGEYWVWVRKVKHGEVRLLVKRNRVPKVVARRVLRSGFILEMPDMNFEAEDVLVLGYEGGHFMDGLEQQGFASEAWYFMTSYTGREQTSTHQHCCAFYELQRQRAQSGRLNENHLLLINSV
ncbi:hypothetical protein IMSHALPRED_010567 [Imshaugia aleurites]|uniref:Uncharacterized protein n=1 Tax=Imshaugia aleurites TaxID=172621 RepID=A0A8H3ESB5_9LECA|nr:hypothetical protein IMSHALPRED_010567 [Imshaugia aleurites]